ncbi:MAG: hypothetical protein ACE5H7_11820 [Acidiferrobacterales bacterium]
MSPTVTDVGLALRDIVGAGGGSEPATSTVTDRLAIPPGPVQDRMKTLVIVSGPTFSVPRLFFSPNQAPEAWQEVALRTDQSSVDEPLLSTDEGLAVSDMTGGCSKGVAVAADASSSPPPEQAVSSTALASNE